MRRHSPVSGVGHVWGGRSRRCYRGICRGGEVRAGTVAAGHGNGARRVRREVPPIPIACSMGRTAGYIRRSSLTASCFDPRPDRSAVVGTVRTEVPASRCLFTSIRVAGRTGVHEVSLELLVLRRPLYLALCAGGLRASVCLDCGGLNKVQPVRRLCTARCEVSRCKMQGTQFGVFDWKSAGSSLAWQLAGTA